MNRYRKLWRILEIALADLRVCEKDKKHYVIDMGTFCSNHPDGHCHVCLAGACLVQSGKVEQYHDNGGPLPWMSALDNLRVGNVEGAYANIHGRWDGRLVDVKVASYGGKQWWRDMEALLISLRERNI